MDLHDGLAERLFLFSLFRHVLLGKGLGAQKEQSHLGKGDDSLKRLKCLTGPDLFGEKRDG